ncbi:MAG TPA: CBS domain-containing protein [Solirubrobacterales bacterium]|nr:CBS domain-containing protein [Solirubrobacterales bacterium]
MDRSYVGPAFGDATVRDAMRVGVITCRPETRLADVARMMVGYDVHSVVVADLQEGERPWGIVTSLDLARGAEEIAGLSAADVATTDLITVSASDSLDHAAALMASHGVTHLVVVQPEDGEPVGVLSAKGLAAALAYGRS